MVRRRADSEDVHGAVRARLWGVDWARAVADVRPFLEPGAQAALLTEENLGRGLGE